MKIRKRTREQARHARAVVLQQLGAQADADPQVFWEHNRRVSARLRARAADPCRYCGVVGGHSGVCPVVS